MRPKISKHNFTKKAPEKKLLLALRKKSGRNVSGKITVRHRGGGVKRMYRIVDFGQEKLEIPGKVIALEYDPYRTGFLALVLYQDNDKRYILASKNLKVGDEVICSEKAEIKIGNRTKLKNFQVGTEVYNIELESGKGGKMIRSAGTAAKIMTNEGGYVQLLMPSGETRKVSEECFASVGQVSNPEKRFEIIRKAGTRRLKGWRPTVRGMAMNPPDHPHGGGEGKTPIGLKYPKTPWGKPTLGVKTRRKKWTDRFIVQRRKNKSEE